jgi:aspartyl-tRNA synthetase
VHRVRDHGGVLFIDLRDHYGMTQIVADPDSPAFKTAETVRGEWVIRVDGEVKARTPEETVNPNLPTGAIEVFAREIEVLSKAELPLPVFGEPDLPGRHPPEVPLPRSAPRNAARQHHEAHGNHLEDAPSMAGAGFTEFQTPILTASSPEGARDFLVPSRIHPGKFYALPQAPQQYKQLLMVSGFDRYFQIAPCFRDEDPRADRLPGEFYQLDLEMSFVTQDDVWAPMEPVIRNVFAAFADGKPVTENFRRIPYDEAIRKYGTDKPDLRNPIEMQDDRALRRFRLQGFCRHDRVRPEGRGVGHPGEGRRQPRVLRPHELLGAGRGPAWPGVHLLARGRKAMLEGAGPIAKNIGPERTEAIRRPDWPR